ncbi:MAG: hypothetical protein AB9869_34955 [Verrucomicrobiia bacterium]
MIQKKGWTKIYREEFDIEAVKLDTQGQEINLFYDPSAGHTPSPHVREGRSPMSLSSLLWKLDALPSEASTHPVEVSFRFQVDQEEARLDRTITRVYSEPEERKVYIEMNSTELTLNRFVAIRNRARDAFRMWLDGWIRR